MQCPECGSIRNIVKDTRRQSSRRKEKGEMLWESKLLKGNVIARVRHCLNKECLNIFYTIEKIINI